MSGTRQSLTARIGARVLRTRWFVRAPIWFYRNRLGFLFGSRLLMLENIGRVSGQRRYVVLEVVDQTPGHYTVVAGFGKRAHWYRNVQANPRVRLWISGYKPVAAIARQMTPSEATQALRHYAAQHPKSWERLRPVLESTLGARIDEQGTTLPVVDLAEEAREAKKTAE